MSTLAPTSIPDEIIWGPQVGPQTALVECPIEDVGFGGARGGGKSDGLIGDYLQHANEYEDAARGMLVRRSYPELEELVDRARYVYSRTGARFKQHPPTWEFPNGAILRARYLERDKDAERYQGWNNTWLGVDEAGNFPSPIPLDKLRATLRTTRPGVRVFYRQTMNPGGPGHAWNKMRYIDPAKPYEPFEAKVELPGGGVAITHRVFIPSTIDDNILLTEADPRYWERVASAAAGQEWLLKAWRFGDWDIVAGGYFSDVWDRDVHIVEPFAIPEGWRIDRSFDWGSAKPFSVGWWAESNGEPFERGGKSFGYVRGDLFRFAEWYGWNGTPNEGLRIDAKEIGRGIAALERKWGIAGRVQRGPADSSIYVRENGPSIADDLESVGVKFVPADKKPGSRKVGWHKLRSMLIASRQPAPREEPGLFVFSNCRQFIRTVPVLQRDERDVDDVDTRAEDHIADETRYRVTLKKRAFKARRRVV